MLNVLVLFGGVSCEHDVSIITGMQCVNNLDKKKYNIIPVYVNKNGDLVYSKKLKNVESFTKLIKNYSNVALIPNSKYLYKKTILGYRKFKKIDVAIPCFHGINGEDGTYAALLNVCGIPQASANLLSSAIAMDKCCFKTYLKGLGVKTINGVSVTSTEFFKNFNKTINKVKENLSYPVIVKPSRLGSSIGIFVCNNDDELINGITEALIYDNKVLIENYVQNIKEVNCAILGDEKSYTISELEEPLKTDEILSFKNKYLNKNSNKNSMESISRKMPPDIPKNLYEEIKKISEKVFLDLKLKGVVRFDFIVSDNEVYLNELNTIPGSLAFYLFKPKNISFSKELDILISCAIKEFENNKKLITTFSTNILDNVELPNKLGGGKL